jgi:hypothetical protein
LQAGAFPTAIHKDPATMKQHVNGRERMEYLIDKLSESRTPIVVPVLAEVLVRAGPATGDYLTKVRSVPGLRIGNFDQGRRRTCADDSRRFKRREEARSCCGYGSVAKVEIRPTEM